jgi:hypothetical protein
VSYCREDDQEEQPYRLRLAYSVRGHDGEWRLLDYSVEIVSTPCHFGGLRYWFTCPLGVNSRLCGRRCRCLYLPYGSEYFGCRECHRLTYQSRRMHRDKIWDAYGKHREYMERIERNFLPARGREAKERRLRRFAVATHGLRYGLAGLRSWLLS